MNGEYEPLRGDGAEAGHIVAFARLHGSKAVVAAVPRLTSQRLVATLDLPIEEEVWKETHVVLPDLLSGLTFRNVFTAVALRPAETGGHLLAADLFRTCPVALLIADGLATAT